MEPIIFVAVVALVITLISSAVDMLQTFGIFRLKHRIESAEKQWNERGDIGAQIGDWLLASEKDGEPSNIDVLSNMVGLAMAKGMRNAYAGEKSGDVRMQKGIDGKVFEAIQDANPEMKIIGTALEHLGLGDLNTPELLPYAAKALGKYIPKDLMQGQIQQNNGGNSGW